MRDKCILYKTQQDEIITKIIQILNLDGNNSIILYELDNDMDKQTKILNLIPDIRKYFNFGSIKGVADPSSTKRPYVSIIRQILKKKYKIISTDYRYKFHDLIIRTQRYIFILI